METHVRDATAPSPGPRENELPHKFHSSQALMSCCSLSIILSGEHLNRPHRQTATPQLVSEAEGSHGQQTEHVMIVLYQTAILSTSVIYRMHSVRAALTRERCSLCLCWDAEIPENLKRKMLLTQIGRRYWRIWLQETIKDGWKVQANCGGVDVH